MPDPTPTGEQPKETPAAPQFDMDALATSVAGKLQAEFAKNPPVPAPAPAPRPVVHQPADPVGEMLAPYVTPAIKAASLAEEAASDAVEFYGAHPDLEPDERKEIERRFKTLRANGVPFKREDIYNHYLGENIEKVVEKRIEKRNAKTTAAANAAATVGAGSPEKAGQVADARTLTTEQLSKAME